MTGEEFELLNLVRAGPSFLILAGQLILTASALFAVPLAMRVSNGEGLGAWRLFSAGYLTGFLVFPERTGVAPYDVTLFIATAGFASLFLLFGLRPLPSPLSERS